MTGRIIALASRPGKDEPMETLDHLTLDGSQGVVEDYTKSKKRQITILSIEAWNATMAELGGDHPWHTRRANVCVESMDLGELLGQEIQIGECRVQIHGETMPCQLMDQLVPGLRAALEPDCRGGVYGSVVRPGVIRPGDTISRASTSTGKHDS